jgi:hypothetical protein
LEDEKERPRLPLTLLSRRKGVLGTAARPWRRKPAGGTIFPKSKLDLHAIAALFFLTDIAAGATVSERRIDLHHRNSRSFSWAYGPLLIMGLKVH